MSGRCSEHLNCRSSSPEPAGHGRRGHGRGGGRAAAHTALNLEEQVPPPGEQHMEEPILEQLGAA